jgi:hypothetical protein
MTFPDDDDSGSDAALAPNLRALLDAHADGPPVSVVQSARLQQRVLLTVGAVTTLSAASAAEAAPATNAAATSTAASTTATSALSFQAVALAVGVALGGAGLVAVGVTRPAPAVTTTTTTQIPTTPPPPAAADEPTPLPAIVLDDVDRKSAEPAAPAKTTAPLSAPDEAAILERARAALQRGDAITARAQLALHERRAPRGALVEERMALQVLAAALAGDVDATERAARAFILRFPDSLYRARVDAAVRQQHPQQQPEQP